MSIQFFGKKKEIWQKIESEFNSSNLTQQFCTASVLRKQWDNIKKITKDKVAKERKEFEDTGGGSPTDVEFNLEEPFLFFSKTV